MDIAKLEPAPWEVVRDDQSGCRYIPHSSGFPMLVVDSDDGEHDIAALEFAALARNAFDVMMRRGWSLTRHPHLQTWSVTFRAKGFETILAREKCGYVHNHLDPFTALVAADKWYKEHIENV